VANHCFFPWTVIRVENRKAYLVMLEEASVRHDNAPFTKFVAEELAAAETLKINKPQDWHPLANRI